VGPRGLRVQSRGVAPVRRHLPQQLHKVGIVPVTVDPEVGEALLRAVEADPTLEITIDVERRTIEAPAAGITATFPLDDFTQHRLLNGLDDIGLTLLHEDAISSFEKDRSDLLPSIS
jgi:3-isopropylmalate/(R)-2-methylmalate dehydratase small subunit